MRLNKLMSLLLLTSTLLTVSAVPSMSYYDERRDHKSPDRLRMEHEIRERAIRDQMRWERQRMDMERREWNRREREREEREERWRNEERRRRRHDREAEIIGSILTEIIKHNRK